MPELEEIITVNYMRPPKQIIKELWQFKNPEPIAEHHGVHISAGVRYLADAVDCWWLIDEIAGAQSNFSDELFQLWDVSIEFDDDGNELGLLLTCTAIEDRDYDDEEIEEMDEEEEVEEGDRFERQYADRTLSIGAETFYVSVIDGKRALSLETETTQAEERMTFLLAWNPKTYEWSSDEIDEYIETIQEYGAAYGQWSTGNTKKIHPGDRVFLIRLGTEPRGIMASGYATSEVHEEEHWDEEKNQQGRTSLYVQIQWDDMLNPDREPIMQKSDLERTVSSDFQWSIQASGITIPEDTAARLEQEWAQRIAQQRGALQAVAATSVMNESESRYAPSPQLDREEGVGYVEEIISTLRQAGFGNVETNRRVERAAVDAVTNLYRARGWDVRSVESERCGFDLHCSREGVEEHVEVKGTQSDEPAFIITANEFRQAQHDPAFVLFVVTNALGRQQIHEYSGKELEAHFDFEPLAFRARRVAAVRDDPDSRT